MTYAIVIDGIVDNIVLWDGVAEWKAPNGAMIFALEENEWCSIGSEYREGETPRFIAAGE